MHRSGTSALTGALAQAGMSLGKSISSGSYDNPDGYFENFRMVDFNDRLLQNLSFSWDRIDMYSPSWSDMSEYGAWCSEAKKLIESEFHGQSVYALKDPRMCVLHSFWTAVLDEMNISVSYLYVHRDYMEIAASLKRRNNFDPERSLALTATYMYHAHALAKLNIISTHIQYRNLVRDPARVLESVAKHLSIDLSIDENKLREFIKIPKQDVTIQFEPSDKELLVFINEIYDLIGQKINPKSKKNGDKKKWPLLYKEWHDHNFFRYLDEKQNSKFAKLLVDRGVGFIDRQAIIIQYNSLNPELEFDLKSYGGDIRALKIIPVHDKCVLQLTSVELKSKGREVNYSLSINFHSRRDTWYYFDNKFPQFIFTPKTDGMIDSLRFHFILLETGDNSANYFFSEYKSDNPWVAAFAAIVKHPLSLLRKINRGNIRKLKSALRRESPGQILRNFRKLLEDKSSLIAGTNDVHQTASKTSYIADPSLNQNKNRSALSLLYVFSELPLLSRSSGDRRSVSIINMMCREHHLALLTMNAPEAKLAEEYRNQGIDIYSLDNWTVLKNKWPSIDVIIYSHYYSYYDFKELREFYANARIIIDSVDLHWLREERSLGIDPGFTSKRIASNKSKEIKAYEEADAVWLVSQKEQEILLNEISGTELYIIPNVHQQKRENYIPTNENKILFIGNFNHHPNVSAVLKLYKDIFPGVLQKIPDVQLVIIGAYASPEIEALGNQKNIQFKGWVSDKELDEIYDEVKLSVAPLLTGAGMKGKITEAISYMTPVLTNALGNEGIELNHGESILLAETDQEMSVQIINALLGKYDLAQIARNAYKNFGAQLTPEKIINELNKSLVRPVAICIVTHNRKDLLKDCVDSLFAKTIYPNYIVCVYSNACTDGTVEYLQELVRSTNKVQALFADKNEAFVKPNNRMIEMFPDRDVVLLNNDTVLTEGWLLSIYRAAYKYKKIGVCGARILYTDGRLQEYGSEIYEDGMGVNYGKGDIDNFRPDYMIIRAVPYVSGCVMYIKREALEACGAFDERYAPCYYEDSDLCYRMWGMDWMTIVTPDSIVYHLEGATAGKDEQSGFKKYQKKNKSLFVSIHKDDFGLVKKAVKRANKLLKSLESKSA